MEGNMLKKIITGGLLAALLCPGLALSAAPQGSFPRALDKEGGGPGYTTPAAPAVIMPKAGQGNGQGEGRRDNEPQPERKAEYSPWQYEQYRPETERRLQESTDDIFVRGLTGAQPLSPERIGVVRQRALDTEEARTQKSPEGGAAKFRGLSLKPGSAIPVLEFFPGNVSVVTFLDSTGAPWPVLSYVVGNGEAFAVQRAGGETAAAANILMITPTKQFADTSLAVTLEPETPIVVKLKVSPNVTKPDYLVTFRADAEGPRASSVYAAPEKNSLVDESMLSFLDGVAPEGASLLRSSDKSVEAWEMNGNYYVRTGVQMLWPAFRRVVKSSGASETWLYEMPKVNSVVLGTGSAPKTVTFDPFPQNMLVR